MLRSTSIQPRLRAALIAVAWLGAACSSRSTPADPSPADERAFLAENAAAMTRMMSAMDIKPYGDVDRDFVEMMIPHHQGGIDMAVALLRHGHNEQLRRLAQEIIVEQQQEIAAMRLALGQPLPASVAAPTEPSARSAAQPQRASSHGEH